MAAGLGFKTFTTGEVLTAADVNGYLMQGILVFATEAARNSAITSPQEGQFAFTKDNNSLWYYTGSAWVASGATGDIEGVTAGVGISGGGTSGTVTITNDMATTITASGDIVVGTGSGTYDNLPIGTTGQVLTADTTVSPYKVKWATASSGAMTKITTSTFSVVSAADIDSVFTSSYNNYLVVMNYMFASTAAADLELQFKYGSTVVTSGYNCGNYEVTAAGGASAASTSAGAQIRISNATGSNGSRGGGFFYVRTVGGSSAQLQISGQYYVTSATSAYTFSADMGASQNWSGIRFKASGADLSGEVTVFGLEK